MNGRTRKAADVVALSLFLALTLLANFLHTETTLQERDDCPACHFHKCSLSTVAVHVVLPVVWAFTANVVPEASVFFTADVDRSGSPRGPPVI